MRLSSFTVRHYGRRHRSDNMRRQFARLLISESDSRLETKRMMFLKSSSYHHCAAKWENPACDVPLLEEAAVVVVKVVAASQPNILAFLYY